MDSCLSPEAYRERFDSGRDEDGAELLSFVDWDGLDTVRRCDQYALDRRNTSSSTREPRKRRLSKPAHPAVLPPLPVSPQLCITREHSQHAADSASAVDNVDVLALHSPQRPQRASPSKPRACMTTASAVVPLALPPLDVQVLQRRRVFLDPTGVARIGVEEILQLHERIVSSSSSLSSPLLQLTALPKRCTLTDEVALMPCHSLLYRYVPSLAAECWREPVRDRDKHWSRDELSVILALHGAADQAAANAMTNPQRQRQGKWLRWDAMKLHVHTSSSVEAVAVPPQRPSQQGESQHVLLRSQGAMISSTYCVVSALGVGVYGRLYSPGLADRPGAARYLRFDAYDPTASRVYSLIVTLKDLESLFATRRELLVAGKKPAILKALIALLYFEYPGDRGSNDRDDDSAKRSDDVRGDQLDAAQQQSPSIVDDATPGSDGLQTAPPSPLTVAMPKLCISPHERMSDAARRRRERDERLQREEAERLSALALLLQRPRRARHRLLCQIVRINGHRLVVSLYHLPTHVRHFVVLAYHPVSARTFTLTVGVLDAAARARVFTPPHRWSAEQKLCVAQSLLPLLRFNGARTTRSVSAGATTDDTDYAAYCMGLAVGDDRTGALSEWLTPPCVQTIKRMRDELVHKYVVDGQRSLQHEHSAKLQALVAETDARVAAIETQTRDADNERLALRARDAELKDAVEAINSGQVVAVVAATTDVARIAMERQAQQQQHELRRSYKVERQQLKTALHALNDRVAGYTRDIAAAREHETKERSSAQLTLDRAVRLLEAEAVVNTRGVLEADVRSASRVATAVRKPSSARHAWLARTHIDPALAFVTSSACVVDDRRVRCSVYQVLAPTTCEALLRVVLYDPANCSTYSVELTPLDWVAYTKQQHDAQLLVPQFAVAAQSSSSLSLSPVAARLAVLRDALTAARDALAKTFRSNRRVTKKLAKTRAQLVRDMREVLMERQAFERAAPWHCLLTALGERMRFETLSTGPVVVLDCCIFRTVLPIVSLAGNDDGASDDDSGGSVVYCHIRVLQERECITFEVLDPLTCATFALAHPDSAELAKEFVVETFMEQQLHLEAIAMSLLLFVNDATGQLDLRFED